MSDDRWCSKAGAGGVAPRRLSALHSMNATHVPNKNAPRGPDIYFHKKKMQIQVYRFALSALIGVHRRFQDFYFFLGAGAATISARSLSSGATAFASITYVHLDSARSRASRSFSFFSVSA